MKKIVYLLTTVTLLLGLFMQINAYEFTRTTSGGIKGTATVECLNLTKSDTKTSVVYTYGGKKPIGAYAYTKIYYSDASTGTPKSFAKSDTDDYNIYLELKSPGNNPKKADYRNSCNSHYYGSYSSTNTLEFIKSQ